MNCLEAAEAVLREAMGPLHYKDITERMLQRRLWNTAGATPDQTVNARLAVEIQRDGTGSRFSRIAPGVFCLREFAPNARSRPRGDSKRAPDAVEKVSMKTVRDAARAILRDHPEGIRYGELVALVQSELPAANRNTIQGSVWNLDVQFPDEVEKPARGLFKPVATATRQRPAPVESPGVREDAFYEPFADWLKNDLGDATEAIPFGGASLGRKWGTPDVIGVYKPRPSDRIKFPHEIISAEIKVDPQQPVVAFGQAVAYRLFSSKTYVVMPRSISQEDQDRLEALCALFGVGLVLFTPDPDQPDFIIRMRAQRFSPDMYFVNEFADALHRHDLEVFNRLFQ